MSLCNQWHYAGSAFTPGNASLQRLSLLYENSKKIDLYVYSSLVHVCVLIYVYMYLYIATGRMLELCVCILLHYTIYIFCAWRPHGDTGSYIYSPHDIYTYCHRVTAAAVCTSCVYIQKGIEWRHLYTLLLEYFLCFEKMKTNLWDNIAVCLCTLPLQSAATVEPEQTTIARQRLGNDVSTAKLLQLCFVCCPYHSKHSISTESIQLFIPRASYSGLQIRK